MSLVDPTSPPSRRELNKAATRDAIADAALYFLRSRKINEFTVDDVATAAGVSRRTFFNYFSSVEAAVASFTQRYLDHLIELLQERPAEEPLLESAIYALSSRVHPGDLGAMAETFTLTQDPSLSRFQLQAWDDCTGKVTAVALSRLPENTDALFIHALVGAVIGSARAAFIVWFERFGDDTSEASIDELRALLTQSVALVNSGFRA